MNVEIDPDTELELYHRIAGKRREIMRLEGIAQDSAAQARADKDALRKAQRELAGLLDETIADRPLFRAAAERETHRNGFAESAEAHPPESPIQDTAGDPFDRPEYDKTRRERRSNPSARKEKPKPYGWEVTYRTRMGTEGTVHGVGSEARIKRKAMLKPHATEILTTQSFTEAQYVNAFGRGRM